MNNITAPQISDRLKWVDLRIDDKELTEKCYSGVRAEESEYTICAASREEKKSTCKVRAHERYPSHMYRAFKPP